MLNPWIGTQHIINLIANEQPSRRGRLTDTNGVGVVRERYWLTFAPGEVRSCTSCHGINVTTQAGHPAPTNTPLALIQLLDYWKTNTAVRSTLVTNTGSRFFQIAFVRRPAESGVTYHVQASADLLTWTDIATYAGSNIVLTANAIEVSRVGMPNETVTIREAANAAATTHHFLRVNVTQPDSNNSRLENRRRLLGCARLLTADSSSNRARHDARGLAGPRCRTVATFRYSESQTCRASSARTRLPFFPILAILFLLGPPLLAQTNAPPEPICGFLGGPHFALEEADVSRGLSVRLAVGDAQAGRPLTLRFLVEEKPRSRPIATLQVEHDKYFHLFLVSTDLKDFFHLHPERIQPGLWAVTCTLPRAGDYRLWSEVKYRGVSYSFRHPLLHVAGPSQSENLLDPIQHPRPDTAAGFHTRCEHTDPLVRGATNIFHFAMTDARGNRVALEPYLGAPLHLVVIKDDLSLCLHGHPDHGLITDPWITVRQLFPQPGGYHVFAQYRPAGAGLAPDESLLAEFHIHVLDPPEGGTSISR